MSQPLSQHDDTHPQQPAAVVTHGRRKLLKLGVGAAPVLMMLSSRSAFACHSTTPSAFGSVCNSRPDILQSSGGRSPGYWKTHADSWPAPYRGEKKTVGRTTYYPTVFNSVFGGQGCGSPFGDSVTMIDVLNMGGGGHIAVARACVAAVLNAASGFTPATILNIDDIVNRIWYQYVTTGYQYFEPIAGVKWYASTPPLPYVAGSNSGGYGGIIGYLNTTWT